MIWVLRVVRMIAILRMLLATGMLRILGWPLLAALGQPGRATKRMLLDLHDQMLGLRAFSGGSLARL
jgi:hypothetical protein